MSKLLEHCLPLSDRFYRVALYLLENQEDAEDAVQELYLKLLRSPHSFSKVQDPLAYGITILKNICIDKIRRRERIKTEIIKEYSQFESCRPDELAGERDYLKMLIREIDKLPEKQALVLRLRAVEGLEYETISRRTGLSQVNIRVLISIARKTLKKKLGYEIN